MQNITPQEYELGQSSVTYRDPHLLPDISQSQDIFCSQSQNNFAIIGYKNVFYIKNSRIVVENIKDHEKFFSIKHFNNLKEKLEKGIKKFKKENDNEMQYQASTSKKKRKGRSVDYTNQGYYSLNNWISSQPYTFQRSMQGQPLSQIFYNLLQNKYEIALDISRKLPSSTESSTLQYILSCLKTIKICILRDQYNLSSHFFRRQLFQVRQSKSNENLSMKEFHLNIFQTGGLQNFMKLKNTLKKIECLRSNLDFLGKFVRSYDYSNLDNYGRLIFSFLGNNSDMDLANCQEDMYFKLLLKLDLRLQDRLNFATKLLPVQKRRSFNIQLEKNLSSFSRLQNILYYSAHGIDKIKQDSIAKICQQYLDQTSNIQTLAYLAYEYKILKKYHQIFKQNLQMSFEFHKIDKLEAYGKRQKQDFGSKCENHYCKEISLFSMINAQEQKVNNDFKLEKRGRICEICSRKMAQGQNYLECAKCFHGGHVNHMLKWFQEYQNCSKIDCPCLCN